MRSVVPPEAVFSGGEDWWRDIDNAEADRTLSRAAPKTFERVDGMEGAMDLFVLAHSQAFFELAKSQYKLAEAAGDLALRYRVSKGIHN